MNTNQLFFAILGSFVVATGVLVGVMIKYLDAKIGPMKQQLYLLVQYMIQHECKIATLEERTRKQA